VEAVEAVEAEAAVDGVAADGIADAEIWVIAAVAVEPLVLCEDVLAADFAMDFDSDFRDGAEEFLEVAPSWERRATWAEGFEVDRVEVGVTSAAKTVPPEWLKRLEPHLVRDRRGCQLKGEDAVWERV